MSRNLYVLACGASPAADLASLAVLAVADGWDVYPGATPMGRTLIDADRLTAVTGHAPRHEHSGRTSGWPPADGIVVAAATLNTVGKLAAGIADTWVLSTVTEHFGLGVPVVVAPCVNPALARHPRFPRNVADLRSWGISVLWDAGRTEAPWMVSWEHMLAEVADLVGARAREPGPPPEFGD